MKLFRILSRNIRDSFKSVFRNFSLSIASISCITITLIVVAIAMALSANVNGVTRKIEGDVTIVVFLDKDISEARFNAIEEEIRQIDNIGQNKDDVVANDKMSIREDLMKSSDTYTSVLEKYDSRSKNPLQDAYNVKVVDIKKMASTAAALKKIEGVDTVKYGEGMVDRLVTIFDVVRQATYLVVIALVIVTAFLISNTIKITIFSRKREIDIMRLVGASNVNIKIPFILEGLFLGIIGSIIPILVLTYGYSALYNYFDGVLFGSFITLVKPNPFIFKISGILVMIGMIVGMIGSWRAVRKHLKI